MSTRSLRKRVDAKFGKTPTPGAKVRAAAEAKAAIALHVLRDATHKLCGADHAGWIARTATGRATAADDLALASLPADALAAAGMPSALAYVKLMHSVLSDF